LFYDVKEGNVTQTDSGVVMVGAASKGIIQRDFQHNAVVFRSPYAKNPFDQVTEQDLTEYKEQVERKQRGEPRQFLL
jgi:adducin